MPYRPEHELKRPDLKGEFLCGHCGKTFCHAASLNRHRLNFHGDGQMCLLCDTKIPANETVRRHMAAAHQIARVFTCGCCNWTFPDKKELHSHNNSMAKTGAPGTARAIAKSARAPGSLSQHELRGEQRQPRVNKRAAKKTPPPQAPAQPQASEEQYVSLARQMLAASGLDLTAMSSARTSAPAPASLVPAMPTLPASWINQLLAMNPLLATFFPMTSSSASSTTSSSETENAGSPEPSGLDGVLSAISSSIANNNEGEDIARVERVQEQKAQESDEKDMLVQTVGTSFLSVNTEPQSANSMSDGRESGLGSTPGTTPSPVSSTLAPNDSVERIVAEAKRAFKRRSIDDICNNLHVKRAC